MSFLQIKIRHQRFSFLVEFNTPSLIISLSGFSDHVYLKISFVYRYSGTDRY